MSQNKIQFFIAYEVDYNPYSGGIIALHKLAHNLSLLGEEVFLMCKNKNPNWLGNIYQKEEVDKDNCIAIYPEVVIDNPHNFKNVIRWLLYDRGHVYPKTDIIYSYCEYFKPHPENKNQYKGILSAFDIQKNIFFNKNIRQKGKSCYIIRKGKDLSHDKHPSNSILIDDYYEKGGYEYLSNIFNECEYFISYDDATFLTIQAAMCGCIPIIIPRNGVSESEWRNGLDLYKFGHAYGNEQREYAKNTLHLLLDIVDKKEQETLEQTKSFIENCYEIFK
jgi:hypothetical protein